MATGKGTALTLLAMLLICPLGQADELHLRDGTVLQGQLQKQSRSGYQFLEVNARRARTIKLKDVDRLVLTYAPPEFVFEDPLWSQQMLDDRLEKDFDPDWGEMEFLRSEHYIVFTNSSAGKRYLKTMEDIYEKFKEVFPFDEPEDARLMPVFLFKTRTHYIEYTARITGWTEEAAAKTGGHAWRDYYATYYNAPVDPIHYHEGAHQLVHHRLNVNSGGSWFQEGMAVYFEGTVFTAEDPGKGMKSIIKSGRATALATLIELPSLLMSSDDSRDASLGSRRYQQAGSLIKFLAEGIHKKEFPALLLEVKARTPWPVLFDELLGASVEQIEEQWEDFYR